MRRRHRLFGPIVGLALLGAALIVPTTASAVETAVCDEGHWPAATQGKPITYTSGGRAGDYLWHNATGCHPG